MTRQLEHEKHTNVELHVFCLCYSPQVSSHLLHESQTERQCTYTRIEELASLETLKIPHVQKVQFFQSNFDVQYYARYHTPRVTALKPKIPEEDIFLPSLLRPNQIWLQSFKAVATALIISR